MANYLAISLKKHHKFFRDSGEFEVIRPMRTSDGSVVDRKVPQVRHFTIERGVPMMRPDIIHPSTRVAIGVGILQELDAQKSIAYMQEFGLDEVKIREALVEEDKELLNKKNEPRIETIEAEPQSRGTENEDSKDAQEYTQEAKPTTRKRSRRKSSVSK